ncbi:MAG TPA: MFS transporter [Streptosporangiaceae bacterium]
MSRAGAALRGGPLARRDFRLLAAGQLTSTVGDYCYAVALPWLILSAHGGPVLLGTVLACYGVPRTVLIPVGGLLADKMSPRAVMLGADTVRAALVAVLAVLAAGHVVALVALGPVAAVVGAGEGLFIPASAAIMPALLPPAQLQAGNALNGAALELGSLAGPVIGGTIVALVGSAPAFAADAATFAISAITLALIGARAVAAAQPATTAAAVVPEPGAEAPGAELPGGLTPGAAAAAARTLPGEDENAAARPAPADPAGPSGLGALGGQAGFWALLRHARLLRVIVVVTVAANFAFGGTFEVALPALAHARFGASGYGAMIACLGAGAVLGTLAAARATGLRRPMLVASALFVADGLTAAVIPFGGIAGAAAACFVFGIANGLGNVLTLTLIQRWAPPQLLGRVMSIVMLASIGMFPVSVLIAGLLVRHVGTTPFFPIAGGILILAVLGALTQREYRTLGASPGLDPAAGAAPEPAT